MNAYLLYAKEVKMAVHRENPSATQESIDKLVHQQWRHILTSEEKRPYFDRAEKLRRDAAIKQQRKRERSRQLYAAASADPGTTADSGSAGSANSGSSGSTDSGSSGSTDSALESAPEGEGEVRSAPASPDSGCPSTPDGSDAGTISPVIGSHRSSETADKVFGAEGSFDLRHSNRLEAKPIPSASHYAATMGGAAGQHVAYQPTLPRCPAAGQHVAYHPMVPQMFPALPLSYLHPYYYPPATMMPPQLQAYYSAHGINRMGYPAVPSNVFGGYIGGQMVSAHPHYGMPVYYASQQRARQKSSQHQHATCCPGASKKPASTASPTLKEIGCGDAQR